MSNTLILCARRHIVLDIYTENCDDFKTVYLSGRRYADSDIMYNENGLAKHLAARRNFDAKDDQEYIIVNINSLDELYLPELQKNSQQLIL